MESEGLALIKLSIEADMRDCGISAYNTGKSIGKVQNIIKGYCIKFDIEEITFFENDKVLYSGDIERFNSVPYTDDFLFCLKRRILNAECKKCLSFNRKKLFLFL